MDNEWKQGLMYCRQSWFEDDWSGITDPVERKKKQNRINQRSWRKRQHVSRLAPNANRPKPLEQATIPDGASLLDCPYRTAVVRSATKAAYEAYTLHTTRPTNLHVLIRLNVLHAIARNAQLMGFWSEGLCKDDYVSPYNDHGPKLPHQTLPVVDCPQALMPTTLQRHTVHHPWIDLFPFPGFRDRLLESIEMGRIDEDELCLDILGVDGHDIDEKPALIVWGDSSDPGAWEVSVSFLKRWDWLLRGSPELIKSTNHWRTKRGEQMVSLLDISPSIPG